MDRKEARRDRYSLFADRRSETSDRGRGNGLDKEDKNRIGVIFASGIGWYQDIWTRSIELYAIDRDMDCPSLTCSHPENDLGYRSRHISMLYGFHGPNFCDRLSLCIFYKRYQ